MPKTKRQTEWLIRLKTVPGMSAARAWLTRTVERRLQIMTECAPERYPDGGLPTHFGDAVGYIPLDYAIIWWCMRPLRLGPEDVFFDIGCGMGRVLCACARRQLKRCIGIEHSPELARIAVDNARTLRGRRTPTEIRIGDAVDADYSNGTVFWLFNPFGPQTLRCVIERIRQSVNEAPRPIRVVYVYPKHDDVLGSSRWLRCTDVRTVPTWIGRATYWSNTFHNG